MKKDISIIVPLYKGKKYINHIVEQVKENVEVLKKQKINVHIELIFVNDFPEEKIECDKTTLFPITIIENQKNEGVHAARIAGFKASQGKYILFLDQDDIVDERYLMSQFDAIGKNDAVICNGFYRNGRAIFQDNPRINDEWMLNNFKLIRSPGQVLILSSSIPKFWIENVIVNSGADDIFLWSLMAIEKKKIVYNNSNLYTHVEDGTNTSFDWEKQEKSLEEVKEKVRRCCSPDIFAKWEVYVNESIIKFSGYAEIEKKWGNLEQKNKIINYLNTNSINSLAVYGYGVIGKRFCDELKELDVKIKYVYDKANLSAGDEIRLISKIDDCEPVDMLIITPIFAYKEIVDNLKTVKIKKIISIGDFLNQINLID